MIDRLDLCIDARQKIEAIRSINDLFVDTVAKMVAKYEELGVHSIARVLDAKKEEIRNSLNFLDGVDIHSVSDNSLMILCNFLSLSLVDLTKNAMKLLAEAKKLGVA